MLNLCIHWLADQQCTPNWTPQVVQKLEPATCSSHHFPISFASTYGEEWVKTCQNLIHQNLIHLVGGWPTPLKNMSLSVGVTIPNIWKVINFMFQTTNQIQDFSEMSRFCWWNPPESSTKRVPAASSPGSTACNDIFLINTSLKNVARLWVNKSWPTS